MNKIGQDKRVKPSPGKRQAAQDYERHRLAIAKGTMIPVDRARVFSRSVIPDVPDFYRDTWFACRDCGKRELWTAKQQQAWFEEQGGEIEAIAIRCKECRRALKLRRAAARRTHQDGLARKRPVHASPPDAGPADAGPGTVS